MNDDQPLLPLDERFRNAEQYQLDLPPPAQTRPAAQNVAEGSCPFHKAFVYECRYCNPK